MIFLMRDDDIRGLSGTDNRQKEFDLRSFIPSLMSDISQYWHGFAEKCFALSG
jgi:hypothetical protein